MTRAAPAKLLGLKDRGHLGAGAIADIAVYRKGKDIAKMFREAALVFKNGELVVKDGKVTHYRWGKTLRLNPPPDKAMVRAHAGLSRGALRPVARLVHLPGFRHRSAGQPFAEVPCRRTERSMASHRRYLRRSLRHARHRDHHHRADTANGRGRPPSP